jgi:DNA helicase HerA-like ATPase
MEVWGYPNGKFMPEHLEILGPTGSGKSYFERTILLERARLRGSHVVVVATKPADSTLTGMGWPIVTHWPPGYKKPQVIYWAKAKGLGVEARAGQRAAVEHLLNQLWKKDANIIVVFDEIAYVEHELGLRTHIATYYREARGLGITIVATTQRPQGVSRYIHSESTWSVFFAPKDEEDAERMAQVAGSKKYYKPVLLDLDRSAREFLLVHNLTNKRYISSIPPQSPTPQPKARGKVPSE